MSKNQIWYEPHPVSPERKAELRAKGLKIIDAAFRPAGHEQDDEQSEGAKKATVAELREALTAKGIEIPEGAKKADLQALLDAQPQ
jgi:hypothetical protein